MKTQSEQPNNPLHGITLETMLNTLIDQYGWEGLYKKIAIKCFLNNPSIKSSLKFLRQSLWAREKVERLYLQLRRKQKKHYQPEPGKDVDS